MMEAPWSERYSKGVGGTDASIMMLLVLNTDIPQLTTVMETGISVAK